MPALKNIPPNISPDLMHALMSMGHSDEIVLADGNFPAASCAKDTIFIRADGQDLISLLESIMLFFPIDRYVRDNCVVMALEPSDRSMGEPEIWGRMRKVLKANEGESIDVTQLDRRQFYTRAKQAYAIVATSETAVYANLILKKGVISPPKKQ
eukprot:TRINITY_DN1146_c0_g1_i1.p1 TRINITY_DN1146_c0_g1~~TRINITY_DN1146_c0_g1_i1.p1  ORF type:complete len:154 (+),score=42.35 TRINITY_DN1146_c0_g1_i1:125-586(+)